MTDSLSSSSSPQNPKLRHPYPSGLVSIVSSSSTSSNCPKEDNNGGESHRFPHRHLINNHHPHDHNLLVTSKIPQQLSTVRKELDNDLENNPFVVTVRSTPGNRLCKSTSSNFIGPQCLVLSSPTNTNTGPRLALYRSNSSLDLLDRDNYLRGNTGGRNHFHHAHKLDQSQHQHLRQPNHHQMSTQGCFTRRKDFGSHGSIDVLSSSLGIVTGVGTAVVGCKQVNLTAGLPLSVMASSNGRDTLDGRINPNELKEGTSSPRLRIKFQKLFEPKEKGIEVPSPSKSEPTSSTTSIFRKFRGGPKDPNNPEINSKDLPSEIKPILRHTGLLGTEERIRRRVLAHYDCQSISANISYAAKLRGMLSKRRNTTTGASAASLGNRISVTTTPSSSMNNIGNICTENSSLDGEESCQDSDLGDGRSNALVLSCPYFRNEIGGELEHIISSTKLNRVSQNSSNYSDSGQATSLESGRSNYPLVTTGRDEAHHRSQSARSLSILEWSPGRSHWTHGICPYKKPGSPITTGSSTYALEAVDLGAEYYRKYFYKQESKPSSGQKDLGRGSKTNNSEHENWLSSDEMLGPLAISIKRERIEGSGPIPRYMYRIIARSTELNTLRGSILEEVIPGIKVGAKDRGGLHSKEVIEFLLPEVQLSLLRLGQPSSGTEEQLLKIDQQILTHRHKIGILYCRNGQATEEEMYNNEEAGPAFNEFLDLIGQRIRLKGFDKYTGGLDSKDDSTGHYSNYAAYQDCEVIFHVSTLLPFTPNNRQQLMRKRHIGNDIVTIVFQEPGAQPFTPKNIRSQFQHVFIIVRAINPCSENTYYSVAVSRSKEVPLFGPSIPDGAQFPKGLAFVEFLLSKAINAENATYRSEKFTTMATRTRQGYLKDLVACYSTNTPIDPRPKFPMLQFGNRKKELTKSKYNPDPIIRGALSWSIWLYDSGLNSRIDIYLAISMDSLVIIDGGTRETIFALPTTSILGWNSGKENCLRIFYHQGECITIYAKELGYGASEVDDLIEIIQRLEVVTQGCETKDFLLQRNEMGQLGFHVQQDGIITEVETCGYAAKAGLKQGSRLVEICSVVVATLSQDEMIDYLKKLNDVVVTIIPPLPDGTTRRGCDAKHCIYTSDPETEYYDNTYGVLSGRGLLGRDENPSYHIFSALRSPNHPKSLLTQAVPGNHRRRYEPRSFSPPRSSNSSGYGTGSSSKSFSCDPHSLPPREGGDMTSKGSAGRAINERWYEISEAVASSSVSNTSNNSPPPIPVRNFATTKILTSRQTHPSCLTGSYLSDSNTKSPSSERKCMVGSKAYFGSPYSEKSFNAKREFFQRNGSFQGRIVPSRSHDLLHLKSNVNNQLPQQIRQMLQKTTVVNGNGDYECIAAVPKAMGEHPRKIGAEKLCDGAVLPLAQNASPTNFITPIIETTLKGKVTYLTDYDSSHCTSTEHLAGNPNDVHEQKVGVGQSKPNVTFQGCNLPVEPPIDLETIKNERLAALKSAYMERMKLERTVSVEITKLPRISAPVPSDISNSSDENSVKIRNGNIPHRTSNNSSPKSGEVKLRPSSATSRGSGGGGHDRTNRNSTLQDDLMRLINPDYMVESSPNSPSQKNNLSLPRPLTLTESVLNSSTEKSPEQWAILVENATKAYIDPSHGITLPVRSKQDGGSDRLSSSPSSSISPSMSLSLEESPSPLSSRDESRMDRDGIITNISKFCVSDNPLPQSVFNLETRVCQLEAELRKEQESKQVLATKVENLQQENRRLLEENHITQDQFNKFKEWLLGAVDSSNLHNNNSSN